MYVYSGDRLSAYALIDLLALFVTGNKGTLKLVCTYGIRQVRLAQNSDVYPHILLGDASSYVTLIYRAKSALCDTIYYCAFVVRL